ncbi:Protein of unknown function (DUF2917) [Burkholderiales bacterium JOSHI_001]|nr:Protein of unknown function (DUF2917) [Burkholderiales bacterium JOSHI_001]
MSHRLFSLPSPLPLQRRLRRDEFLHLQRPPVLRLRAECGTLWVTVDGEPQDFQIEAGQGRVFDGQAPITVGSLGGDAVFSATPLAPPVGRLRRWWQALAQRVGAQAQELRT